MIHADDVMPLLLVAAPSFEDSWQKLEADPIHIDEETGTRLHYLDAGDFTRHLVSRHRAGDTSELRATFGVIERLHIEGDDYVRELATIGYLEGVQTAASHADVDPADLESHLGPESNRWWRGLKEFWAGRAAAVLPID